MARHNMTCCCCGESAGRFEQWYNRDTGYGCCADCVEWQLTKRGVSPDEIRDLYGEAGIHRKPAPSERKQ